MKVAALLSLVSAAFFGLDLGGCYVTIRGTKRFNIPLRGTFNFQVFKKVFNVKVDDQKQKYSVPELRNIDDFHYSASYDCGQCILTVPNLGKPGMQTFVFKGEESQSYALQYKNTFPPGYPIIAYVQCLPKPPRELVEAFHTVKAVQVK
jgi:hypothetical protein